VFQLHEPKNASIFQDDSHLLHSVGLPILGLPILKPDQDKFPLALLVLATRGKVTFHQWVYLTLSTFVLNDAQMEDLLVGVTTSELLVLTHFCSNINRLEETHMVIEP
jgi:hypothetical protein